MNTLLAQTDLGTVLFTDHSLSPTTEPLALLSAMLPNAYVFAGIILFVYLIFGGFTLITSSGNPQNAQQGQKTIMNAIIGFIIIFMSYWIIQIIQIITGIRILSGQSIF